MSPLLRKELRLIAFPWVGALLAATVPFWVNASEIWVSGIYYTGMIILALAPFGHEVSGGTLSLQLVQPISRNRVWRIKASLLALAVASVWFIFVTGALQSRPFGRYNLALSACAMALPALAGGLWIPVLLRETISSFFCIFLVPTALSMGVFIIAEPWHTEANSSIIEKCVIVVLGIYSIAGICWSRRVFCRAQDVPWTGGQISFQRKSSAARTWLRFDGPKNRYWALVMKELQLQEITLLLVVVLLVLHGVCLLLRNRMHAGSYKEIVSIAIPVCWLFSVPYMMGCSAIAEERRLNTLEGALCLPVRKRDSYLIKLAVVCFLGAFVGGMFPGWFLQHSSWGATQKDWIGSVLPFALLLTILGLFSSSLARTLLQAIPIGIVTATPIAVVSMYVLSSPGRPVLFSRSYIPILLGLFAFTGVGLGYRNYRRSRLASSDWFFNGITLSVAMVALFATAGAIYHRVWELAIPLEQAHGTPRILGTPKISGWDDLPIVLFPDGRLWAGTEINAHKMEGVFLGSNDWIEVAPKKFPLALRADGTLWKIDNEFAKGGRITIKQIGKDSDWKKFAFSYWSLLLLKQNGALWSFDSQKYEKGKNPFFFLTNLTSDKWNGPFDDYGRPATSRYMVGRGRRWRATVNGRDPLCLLDDGTLWTFNATATSIFGQQFHPKEWPSGFEQSSGKINQVGESDQWIGLAGSDTVCAALEADGELHLDLPLSGTTVSKNHDWLAIEGSWGFVALAKDGTLAHWAGYDYGENRWFGPSRLPLVTNIFDYKQ